MVTQNRIAAHVRAVRRDPGRPAVGEGDPEDTTTNPEGSSPSPMAAAAAGSAPATSSSRRCCKTPDWRRC